MTTQYRHRRTSDPTKAFPSPLEPGEICVNTANRQIAAGDADATQLGSPLILIAVRVFDARAKYAVGDFVVNAGTLYRANTAVNPGPFVAAQWDAYSSDVVIKAYADSGDAAVKTYSDNGDAAVVTAFQAADTTLQTNINGKVSKAGDTMTGQLTLPNIAPAAANAVRKDYVDAAIASNPPPDLSGYAPLASPTFTGDPKAPTPAAADNDTSIATTAFVKTAINAIPAPPPPLYISDTPPIGAPDNAMWWESDSGNLYVRYNDGDTTQWVLASPQADFSGQYIRFDQAQALSAAQQQQARANIYAAPFDALAYNGMQINGSMDVSQEKLGSAVGPPSGSPVVVCDGWDILRTGSMTLSAATFGSSGAFPGLASYLMVTTTAAQASLAAGDVAFVFQNIEGYRVSRLAWGTPQAQPITIGFWSGHHRPGLYTVAIRNGNATRSYVTTYTQNVADAAEYKTVTIPGCTDGTWAVTTSSGLNISFTMAAGASLVAPAANSWQVGNYIAAPGQVNAVAATTDAFRITGVIVVPGNEAPSAARSPFIMRSFDEELQICKRYYEKSYAYNVQPGTAVGAGANGFVWAPLNIAAQCYGMISMPYSVEKRAGPTVTVYAGNGAPNAASIYSAGSWADVGGAAAYGGGPKMLGFYLPYASGPVIFIGFDYTADARL